MEMEMTSKRVVTTNMGSCQYDGCEAWQRAERRMPIIKEVRWCEPRRKYNSEISEEQYRKAMEALR